MKLRSVAAFAGLLILIGCSSPESLNNWIFSSDNSENVIPDDDDVIEPIPKDKPIEPDICSSTNQVSTVRPKSLNSNVPRDLKIPLDGSVHAMTWDGRVFIITRPNPQLPHPQGWYVAAFRPENVGTTANGEPIFGSDVVSEQLLWEEDGTPNTGTSYHNTLALIPKPGLLENPFRSDRNGSANISGDFLTYEFLVVSPTNDRNDMGIRPGRIVVANPNTKNSFVEKAEMLGPNQLLRTTSGATVRGLEPSLTFDGKVLFFQGSPANDGGIDYIMYSYNSNPGSVQGWATPKSISDLYHVDRDKNIGGSPLHELLPLAKQPLIDSSGRTYRRGEYFYGAYPWISQDGTELFFTTITAGCKPDDLSCPEYRRGEHALRGGFSVIGRWTNWILRHIDGPSNPNRFATGPIQTVRTLTNSPGAIPGMWRPYREVDGLPLPYTGMRPIYPLIGAVRSDYQEVSFEDFQDKNYLVFLRMNEMISRDTRNLRRHRIFSNLTPDTSGNILNGQLNGALFPQEYNGRDENIGIHGQAIYFSDQASVTVPFQQKLNDLASGFTVEFFVKRLIDMSGDEHNRYRLLVHKPMSFHLIMEENGQIHATTYVNVEGQPIERKSGPVGSPISLNEWSHFALSYSPKSGRMIVYQNGARVWESKFEESPVNVANTQLIVGPGSQITPLWTNPREPLFVIDEFKLSKVVRSTDEIRMSAYKNKSEDWLVTSLNLPLGLKRSEVRIPRTNAPSPEAIRLGEKLFHDVRLSKNNDMSCATCHSPSRMFTDGLERARGADGRLLRRNTPTIMNRALSTHQLWDGRADSLEEQALMPIEDPTEMNLKVDEALSRLGSDPEYIQLFKTAYSDGITRTNLAKALASFQRSILLGDSRVDRFESGQTSALSESEIRGRAIFMGKARCISCHDGSNYTDEGFHNTGFTCTTDRGLEESTGSSRDRRLFKTPSLRGISLTAPYLHDGSFQTLEEVIDTYNMGGIHKDNLDNEMRPLHLTSQERQDLLNFLRAL